MQKEPRKQPEREQPIDPADERQNRKAGSAELPPDDGPVKQHGDALVDGSGSRHGVDDRDERPNGA